MEHLIRDKKDFICVKCKGGETSQKKKKVFNEGVIPTKCHFCKGKLYSTKDYLDCKHCPLQWHKQDACSGMTRKQRENLERETWKCLLCQQEEADASPDNNTNPDTAEGEFKGSKFTSVRKLKILQLNIENLRTNVDELTVFLQKHKIDIFAIQETKLIAGDPDPVIPGYAVRRKDRTPEPGCTPTHGGGLLTGIKIKIPFHPVEIKTKCKGDIQETDTIEIPLADGKKIRITNVYARPVRSGVDTF